MPAKSKQTRQRKAKEASAPLAINTVDQLKALAHPVRQRLLGQFSKGPATTKQVANILGLRPTGLYHHVGKLEAAGLLEMVETRQVRGATEKYYATTASSLKIDRSAFEGPSAELVQGLLTQGIVDSLLSNIRTEFADYLASDQSRNANHKDQKAVTQDVLFAETEVFAPPTEVKEFKEKLLALIEDFSARSTEAGFEDKSGARHRVLIGCYPIVSPGEDP